MSRAITVDPSVFIGPYPFREVPHPDPEILVKVLEREQIERAWVGHLPAAWEADPSVSNDALFRAIEPHRARLSAAPTIRPDRKGWERALSGAAESGAAAIRAYPAHWEMKSDDRSLRDLALAAGVLRLPLILTVRFEDLRQRDARDTAGDLAPQVVRTLARAGSGVRLIVSAAGKDFVEEVHWGLTPEEQRRVVWDIGWIWGPPEDHLAKLFRTVGSERFVFGSQWPLRLVQSPFANLELLPDSLAGAPLTDPARLFP
jgi:hypothetical protein